MVDWYQKFGEDIEARKIGSLAVEELKETRLLEGVIAGKTGTVAALEAGYKERDARAPVKLIESSELRARFQSIAEQKGLTLHRVVDKMAEHLEARANQTLEGKEVTQSKAPDYKVQQKALDQLTSLMGMQDAGKVAGGASTVTLSISGPAADRLAKLLGGE